VTELVRIGELTSLQGTVRARAMDIESRAFRQPWSKADFDFIVADPRAVNLALWCGQELAGYAMALVEGPDLHLVSLAVDEAYRRHGWGTRLVEELARRASLRGCRTCRLEVRRSNRVAQALYRRCGFDSVGVACGFYTRPAEDALVLERFTGPAATAPAGARTQASTFSSGSGARTDGRRGGAVDRGD